MSIKKKTPKFLARIIRQGINVFGSSMATQISAHLTEVLSLTVSVQTDFGEIKFFCPSKVAEWRARTLLIKEPETIEWINTFKKVDIF